MPMLIILIPNDLESVRRLRHDAPSCGKQDSDTLLLWPPAVHTDARMLAGRSFPKTNPTHVDNASGVRGAKKLTDQVGEAILKKKEIQRLAPSRPAQVPVRNLPPNPSSSAALWPIPYPFRVCNLLAPP